MDLDVGTKEDIASSRASSGPDRGLRGAESGTKDSGAASHRRKTYAYVWAIASSHPRLAELADRRIDDTHISRVIQYAR